MKFPFLFKATEITATTTTPSPWLWPSCANNPRTLSFQASANDSIYKTINSVYLEDNHHQAFSDKSYKDGKTFSSPDQPENVESAVVRGLRSERLFFEPGETKSILEEAQKTEYSVDRYNARVAIMVIESTDPFVDFRVSMEEMVEAHGMMRDNWECLEEMLAWYLRVNGKSNHGYILGAFVDLLIDHLASASSTNDDSCSSTIDEKCSSSSSSIATRPSFTSPLSFSSSTYSDLF